MTNEQKVPPKKHEKPDPGASITDRWTLDAEMTWFDPKTKEIRTDKPIEK